MKYFLYISLTIWRFLFSIWVLNSSEIDPIHDVRAYPNQYFHVDSQLSYCYILDFFRYQLPMYMGLILDFLSFSTYLSLYQYHTFNFCNLQYSFITGRAASPWFSSFGHLLLCILGKTRVKLHWDFYFTCHWIYRLV